MELELQGGMILQDAPDVVRHRPEFERRLTQNETSRYALFRVAGPSVNRFLQSPVRSRGLLPSEPWAPQASDRT